MAEVLEPAIQSDTSRQLNHDVFERSIPQIRSGQSPAIAPSTTKSPKHDFRKQSSYL